MCHNRSQMLKQFQPDARWTYPTSVDTRLSLSAVTSDWICPSFVDPKLSLSAIINGPALP